jgi:ferric-dicitrate binding protein FerR (iron transport regulator)
MINNSDRLVEAYLDNELQDADFHALCTWLQADRENAQRFVRACFLHWELYAIGQRKSLQKGVSELPSQTELVKTGSAASENGSRPSSFAARTRTRARFKIGARAALAAALLVACGIGVWMLVPAGLPKSVAQLTQTGPNVIWANASASPQRGASIREGQLLELNQGRILATLSNGVQVVVRGPAKFKIDAENLMYLQTGRITVAVPRQASGFVVESPVARFVDLGTEFTLDMQPDSGCELHVFSGLVEMQPRDARRADRLRIPEGRAIKYDAPSGSVETLPYQASERMAL